MASTEVDQGPIQRVMGADVLGNAFPIGGAPVPAVILASTALTATACFAIFFETETAKRPSPDGEKCKTKD